MLNVARMLSVRFVLVPFALVACGTETPRTTKPDAGFPAAPFDRPAALVGAEAGAGADADAGAEAGVGAEAGAAEGGAAATSAGDAASADAGAAAPASSALIPVVPFTVVLRFVPPHELRLESNDRQTFSFRMEHDPGAWFASKPSELARGELAHWTAPAGGVDIGFRRSTPTVVTARVRVRADAGTKGASSKDYRFAVPAAATLFVESRDSSDAGR